MQNDIKFVDYGTYCKLCKYEKDEEVSTTCDECLETPANFNSVKPINFKQK